MNIKRILSIVIIIILLVLIRNISVSIYTQLKNEDTVDELKEQLSEEKRRQAFLTQRLAEVQTDSFIEKEARQKLGLARENEYQVAVAPPDLNTPESPTYELPNWKKWKEVFNF